MAVRKHNGKEYPVPGIDTAIKIIRPTAKWSITGDEFDGWEDEAGTDPPTWDEINAEMAREVEIYNYYLYERNREKEFPDLKDQLDMLYHDIKSGNLNNGKWITAIDAVKEKFPKPSEPEPDL
tara:strand:+ start:50 stop:418 length:369 start_codon:yes stop_codon:yes gene_type:complete